MPPLTNTQLKELLSEVSDQAKSISKLSDELQSLTRFLDPVLHLHNGNEVSEPLGTRVRLLEEQITNIHNTIKLIRDEISKQSPECKLQDNKFEHAIELSNNKINDCVKSIADIKGSIAAAKKENKELEKEKRVNIKDISMEILKVVLAIISAVVIVKLTGHAP